MIELLSVLKTSSHFFLDYINFYKRFNGNSSLTVSFSWSVILTVFTYFTHFSFSLFYLTSTEFPLHFHKKIITIDLYYKRVICIHINKVDTSQIRNIRYYKVNVNTR